MVVRHRWAREAENRLFGFEKRVNFDNARILNVVFGNAKVCGLVYGCKPKFSG
jgi:hypothetical protein